jgi:hypothetical protein
MPIYSMKDKPECRSRRVAHNPWASLVRPLDMTRDEAIISKPTIRDPAQPHCVPHSARRSSCPKGVLPRASIEMRGTLTGSRNARRNTAAVSCGTAATAHKLC